MVPQNHRSPFALGQFGFNPIGGVPGAGGGLPGTGTELRCFKCGLNPPMLMLPSTASFNPTCVEVDASQCAEQQAEIDEATAGSGSPWATPDPGAPAAGTFEVVASLTVYEPTELRGLAGAAVEVLLVNPYDGSTTSIATGSTDASGHYAFIGNVQRFGPSGLGQAPGNLRFIVTPGSAEVAFPTVTTETRDQGRNTMPSFVAVCPPGTPTVVCEVAKGRAMWKTVYEQQMAAWGSPSTAADWAHSAVMNGLRPTDPGLQRYWMHSYSWWIGVDGIMPKEWPELIQNTHQVFPIFAAIPFPEWPGIEDYFARCARGIPFAMAAGPDGENYNITNPFLYISRTSTYFPRDSNLIERDMAVAYSDGLQQILACIVHLIKQKLKEIERSAKAMSIISLGTIVAFSPFLIASGASGVAVLATEAYEFVKMQKEGTGLSTYGVTAALAAAMLAAGNIDFVVAALEPALGDAMADMDPLAKQAVNAALPQILESASDAVLGPQGIGSGLESGGGAIGGAAVSMAIKMIAGIAKNYAANRIEEGMDAAEGAQQAADDVMALVEGREAGPHFKPFINWVVKALGFEDLVNQAIDEFLDEFANALGIGTDHGGGVAIVDEQDGGGPAVVPTDSTGTPIDADGNPLPGGQPPRTPLKDFETGPSDLTKVASVGGTTALLLVAGGVL